MSQVEISIVAPARDQTAASAQGVAPGMPVERVSLIRESRSAADVAFENSQSADAVLQTTIGNRLLDARAKARQIVIAGTLTPDQFGKLTQFKEDSRAVYLCPNYDERTWLSAPLLATGQTIAGPNLAATGFGPECFAWDAEAQVMRTTSVGFNPVTEGGPFGKYGRVQRRAITNFLTHGHPNTTSIGWTDDVHGNASHDAEFPTPVLGKRYSSTEKGIAVLDAYNSDDAVFEHEATGLSPGYGICCSLLIMTPRNCTVSLRKADGTESDSINVVGNATTYGKWQLVKLAGTQSASGSTAKIRIVASNSTGGGYMIRVGSCGIYGHATGELVPDWVDPAATSPALSYRTISFGIQPNSECFTVSCIAKYGNADGQFPISTGMGILRLGTSAMYLRLNFSTANIEFSATGSDSLTAQAIVDLAGTPQAFVSGDFIHIVVTSSRNSRKMYVNGVELAEDTTTLNGGQMDSNKRVGYGGSTQFECYDNGGLCLLRCDHGIWDAAEVLRHYTTFGQPIGQAVVRQTYGRLFEIADLSGELFTPAQGSPLYSVELLLSQLDEGRDFAPVRRADVW